MRYDAVRRCATLFALVVAMLAMGAAPAAAHASLLETTPADGAILDEAPTEVVLRFSEAVGTSLGTLKVLSPTGARADAGRITTRAADHEVVATLRTGLDEGTYLLVWRVVSEDGHPVAGSSIFSIGRTSAVADASAEGGAAARRVLGVARFVAFAGLAVLVGVVVFVSVVDRLESRSGAVVRLVSIAAVVAAIGTITAFLVQGPYGAGAPLADAFRPTLVGAVAETRFGVAMLVRLVAIVVLAVATRAWVVGATGWSLPTAVAAVAAAALATSTAGHAGVGDLSWVAVPLDAVHLVAAGAWVGGLALLVAVVLPRDAATALAGRGPDLARVLPRWSRVAAAAVVLLVVTGTFASWREVRELPALAATTYGRLLIAKVELVLGMLVLGAVGREWVRRHAARADVAPVARLRRGVAWEAGVAAVVLAVTASLVETTPARSSYSPPFVAQEQAGGNRDLEIRIEPARAGVNELTVTVVDPDGRPADVAEITGRAMHTHGPGHDSGASDVVAVTVPRVRLGRYAQDRLVLPMPGTWRLELVVRTSEIDATTLTFTVAVR